MSKLYKQFGVLITNFQLNQKSYTIIKELNRSINHCCPIVFFIDYDFNYAGKETPFFSRMQIEEVWNFPFPCIANDIETAKILINSPLPTKKYLYLWDLDWTYYTKTYEEYKNIYTNLQLITRCKHHQKIVKQCWLQDSIIIEDFNYEQIINAFGG